MNTALLNADKTFTLESKDAQPLEEGQVRLDVAWCGICGTDLHIYRGHMDKRLNFPEVIGHEASATVAEVGPGVTEYAVGDAVVVRPLDACGECPACERGFGHVCNNLNFIGIDSSGAFQQSWNVPAKLLHRLPEGMNLELAAFVEPLAVACHDVRMAGLKADEFSVVLGGGPIGLLIAMAARAVGARVAISELSESRLELAQKLGFDTINAGSDDVEAAVIEKSGADGADVVFEVSGAAPPIRQMTKLARVRGRVVVVAIVPEPTPVDLFQVFWKELQIIGTRVYEPEDYDRAIELLASGEVDPSTLVTGRFGLSQIGEAFQSLDTDSQHMKILVNCQD
ncbi:zinc-dependent alcohol dehydrogenase [Algisphaera agarilytica]|uniref:2-desacetyl-2-hydroxyethyl bacteriochlorophyllide A dehydrogenase n=1 Tax=Algisphaera agarilytica TaxID=1385975 RepID=A0A7X0H8V6_9BACT|nr:alcohol dehydrogenase catalytic domain-containing protein [Algisphaera agarilytica]MBB6431212.1 2-desacetyl-2-hydroxyethyl bacteriochlorophyllide A dehydrogenase [Algisphaera agarilytica]